MVTPWIPGGDRPRAEAFDRSGRTRSGQVSIKSYLGGLAKVCQKIGDYAF
jgi:hypothetical protein